MATVLRLSRREAKRLGIDRGHKRPHTKRNKTPQGASHREAQFIAKWTALGGPFLDPQVKFHPDRKWSFDFAHMESHVAVEIHGATFTMGRHVRGQGFAGDRIKMNAAMRLNWKVFELTVHDIDDERVIREILLEINERLEEGFVERTGSPFRDVFADRRKSRRPHKTGRLQLDGEEAPTD